MCQVLYIEFCRVANRIRHQKMNLRDVLFKVTVNNSMAGPGFKATSDTKPTHLLCIMLAQKRAGGKVVRAEEWEFITVF